MKQKTIKLLGLLGGITVATTMGVGKVSAIPVVDNFETNHNEIFARNGFTFGTTDNETQASESPTADDILGNERDVNLIIEPGFTVGDGISAQSSANLNNNQRYQFQVEALGSGADITATDHLTYDGADGSADFDTGFDPTPGMADTGDEDDVSRVDTDADSNFGFNVRTNVNGNLNNVFTLKNFSISGGNEEVDIELELFDEEGDSVRVVQGGVSPAGDPLNLTDADNGDVFIALKEGDIQAAGIDTDGRFFEDNPDFDFTQVTGVKFAATLKATGTETVTVNMDSMEFEGIPFEAESSIGIGLFGAWGIWKRWKKQGEETAEESNVS
jgi:hypothetical protein